MHIWTGTTAKGAADDGLKSCAGCNHYHGSWVEVEACEASAEASNEARCREIMEAWTAEHGPPPLGMAWSPEWVFERNAEGEQEPVLVDVVAVDPPVLSPIPWRRSTSGTRPDDGG